MICTKPDDFIEEKTRWIADLSNGLSAYQDDFREGYRECVAWKRLKEYVKSEKISIITLHLQFRSNIIHPCPPNTSVEGFFFSNKIVQFLGGGKLDFVVLGFLKDGLVYRKTYKVPELILSDEDILNEKDVPEDFLIRNQ